METKVRACLPSQNIYPSSRESIKQTIRIAFQMQGLGCLGSEGSTGLQRVGEDLLDEGLFRQRAGPEKQGCCRRQRERYPQGPGHPASQKYSLDSDQVCLI